MTLPHLSLLRNGCCQEKEKCVHKFYQGVHELTTYSILLQAKKFLLMLQISGKQLTWGPERLNRNSLWQLNPGEQIDDEIVNIVLGPLANKNDFIWTPSTFLFITMTSCVSGAKDWSSMHRIVEKVSAYHSEMQYFLTILCSDQISRDSSRLTCQLICLERDIG